MRFFVSLILALTPVAGLADMATICDELWLTRNAVFDRQGQCFQSPLGQAIFDNSDCSDAPLTLTADDERILAKVGRAEREFACAVDSSQNTLDLDHIATRLSMVDLPVRSGFGFTCLEYNGPALLLTAGRHPETYISGEVLPGMDLFFLYDYDFRQPTTMAFLNLGDGNMGWVSHQFFSDETCPHGFN